MKTLVKLTTYTLMLACAWVHAADHSDGPNVKAEPAADISDYFIFPRSNGDMEPRVTLVLSVNPNATFDTLFSDAINFRMRMRPISSFSKNPFVANVLNQETRIDCRFTGVPQQTMNCALSKMNKKGNWKTITKSSVLANSTGGGKDNRFRLYAGAAADQLFSDRARVRMPVWRDEGFNEGEWAYSGLNSQAGKNVLSIVVDLDLHHFFGKEAALFASVSETALISQYQHKGKNTETLKQIDRMGRVETTVFIVRNDKIKDQWNSADTFNTDPKLLPSFRQEVEKGLVRLDRFELSLTDQNVIDWGIPNPWTELILNDFLIVDLAHNPDGTYGVAPSTTADGYLHIEKNQYLGNNMHSIGGRVINENVITTMLTYLINGLHRPTPSRGVGVQSPARPAIDGFPFVAPPFK